MLTFATPSIQVLASSSGGHDYLYGLFFLIVALVIGAATRHFLQKIPLPFTVLLLIFGLAMGALNRAYGPHGGQGHDTVATHEEVGFFRTLCEVYWIHQAERSLGEEIWMVISFCMSFYQS